MTNISPEELYTQYSGKILGYIRSKVNDPDLAEDLCSEVFLKVCEKLDSFDESKASLSTWIYTIARNTLTDHYRVRRVTEEVPETLAQEGDIEEDLCRTEQLEILADALQRLDERSRDIILLSYYEGLPLTEVSRRMGISYAYIKVLRNKALGELRKYF